MLKVGLASEARSTEMGVARWSGAFPRPRDEADNCAKRSIKCAA